jgi:spectinomycin phosphotransferase
MLEKPNVSDQLIIDDLQHLYGLQIVKLEFLPIGNDANAWVYKALADNHSAYFIKLIKHNTTPAGIFVPYYLHQAGINAVVSAIPNRNHDLWTTIENSAFIVYPYIDGQPGMDVGLSLEQWRDLGAILAQIHAADLPPEIASNIPRETFVIKQSWMTVIGAVQDSLLDSAFADALEEELGAFWRAHSEEIAHIISRTQELGRQLQASALPFVLCHADIHTANILIDREGQLFIVDWDGICFAPKERDLMFIVGERADGVLNESEQAFLNGYGQSDIDWLAAVYYRYEWVVQEIADYAERVFLMPDSGTATKQDAVRGFKQLFLPGDVVALAYALESHLS